MVVTTFSYSSQIEVIKRKLELHNNYLLEAWPTILNYLKSVTDVYLELNESIKNRRTNSYWKVIAESMTGRFGTVHSQS